MAAGSDLNPVLVRRLAIIVAVPVVALFLGMKIPTQPALAGGLVIFCILVFLLFARPLLFSLLLLFFLFEAFDLIDVDRYARIPGLFRAKDLLLFMLVGYTIAGGALGSLRKGVLRRSRLFAPIVALLIFLGFQMWRTHVLMHEQTILLFRQGRHYLSYGLPLLFILLFRKQKDWKTLDTWCLFFVLLITALNFLNATVVHIPFYTSIADVSQDSTVFKSYNPAGLLTYWFFFRRFWMFCHKPNRQHLVWLGILAFAVTFYFGRANIAGAAIGLAFCALLMPGVVRTRALITLFISGLFMISVTIAATSVAKSVSPGEAVVSITRYFTSTATDLVNVEGTYYSRVAIDRQRYPLVKQHPFVGIGFVSVFGEVAFEMWQTGVLPVGTIDTGWLDLMLRLGGVGTLILLIMLLRGFRLNRSLARHDLTLEEKGVVLANMTLIVMSTLTIIAGGELVWEPGITTIAIALGWTMWIEGKKLDEATAKTAAGSAPELVPVTKRMPV